MNSKQKARDRQAERDLNKQHVIDKAKAAKDERERRKHIAEGIIERGFSETPAGGSTAPRDDDGAPHDNTHDAVPPGPPSANGATAPQDGEVTYSSARRNRWASDKLLLEKVK